MVVAAFEIEEWEEEYFHEAASGGGFTLAANKGMLTAEAANALEGVSAVSVLNSPLDKSVLAILKARGVKYITTRTVGYDRVDLPYAKSIGLRVTNAQYPPDSVAEFTLMLMLLCLRHYKASLFRMATNDYSLRGLSGRELGALTVGVVGTGHIGNAVIRLLAAFGCSILAFNRSRNPEIEAVARYTDLQTLYRESDLISFHLPLMGATRHMVNDDSLSLMKDGVVLVNTSRGELMRTKTLITGIESQKIGALGLDVFEGEKGIYHCRRTTDIITNRDMAYLRQFPNVVMTQHMAFFTRTNVREMVLGTLSNLRNLEEGKKAWEL